MKTAILTNLFKFKDDKYALFIKKLTPDNSYPFFGVRIVKLRKYAKKIYKSGAYIDFIKEKHQYFEEFLLHRMILENFKDYFLMIKELDILLPYLNSWALVDGFNNKVILKNKEDFKYKINEYFKNKNIYIVRFAINMVMTYFTDEENLNYYMKKINNINTDNYYLKMSIAWFFQHAFSKQYDITIEFFKYNKIIDKDIKKYLIQKIKDSYQIDDNKTNYIIELINK